LTRRDTHPPNVALRASSNATIIAAPRHQTIILIAAALSSRSSRYKISADPGNSLEAL